MLSKHRFLKAFALFSFFSALGISAVFAADWKTLPGHVPRVTRRLAVIGELPATNELRLAIGLPLRDAAGLDKFLAEIGDPANPNFRHYLTPEEFTARFGPTEADYAAVKNFALANGLNITATHGNRLLLDVRGSAADVERAFHLRLQKFRHPTEARDFFAPDAEPSVDVSLPVADVAGLSDYVRPYSKLRPAKTISVSTAKTSAMRKSGSAPGGGYLGTDLRNAYAPGTTLTGAGQMVGLLQFDGFYSNDIVAYENLLPGSPRVPIQTVLLDNFNGKPTTGPDSGNSEVSLDIEMAIAMAPGLAKIVVFEASLVGGQPNDILNAMAASSTIKNLSCSWGWSGTQNATTEIIFKQMAAQGQSFFNATGDSDAFTPGQVDDPSQPNSPSASPNITQVGGTSLTMNGAGSSYSAEAVWNAGAGTGSSGGVSAANSIPAWQQGLDMTANHGSTTGRNLPDVAMVADSVYATYGNGSADVFVGTSISAPLWAGYLALVNQQAAATGNPPAGFINPALYALARSASYDLYFHDTTVGDNYWSASPTNFPATTGYDLCTGWGTPRGTNFINALATFNPSAHIADTVRPTLSIVSPSANAKWSNTLFTVSGTASDNVAVSNVFYSLNGADWTLAATTNNWINWSADVTLVPGTNLIRALAQDTSGNLSTTNRVNLVLVLNAPLTVYTNGRGSISPKYNGTLLQIGLNYNLTATAAAGFRFTNWTDGADQKATNGATLKFTMESNLVFTANFVDIARPTNRIISPTGGQRWSNSVFAVAGSADDNVGVANVFYSLNQADWQTPATANGWSNWTAGITLTPGTNVLQAYAVDGAGNFSTTNKVGFIYISNAPLTVSTNGRGSITPSYNGVPLHIGFNYMLTATAAAGFKFTSWTDGNGNAVTNRSALTFMMASNLAFTANFADIARPTNTIIAPTAGLRWSNYVFTIAGTAKDNVGVTNVFYSLNQGDWTTASTANNWSNWTAQVNLVPGTNTILACAVDAAGNISATNKVSFVYVFAMGGLWNAVQFQTPEQMTLNTDNADNALVGGSYFGFTNGTISFSSDGTLNGQFEEPFTGTYLQGSNGLVAASIVFASATNNFNLYVNPRQDAMMLVDAGLDADNNQQEVVLFQRAPITNTLSSMAGSWNVLQLQTPAQMTLDSVNGLQGGASFAATNGSLVLNASGSAGGNLGGLFTGSYGVGSNGAVNLLTVDEAGQTNGHTLFVSASRNTMALAEGQFDTNGNEQQLMLFQRVPASVSSADVAGLWNVVQFETPARVAWDASDGLTGGTNFAAASGFVVFNANGSLSGNLAGAFTGNYKIGNAGAVKLTVIRGGETNTGTFFINASKDGMTGVDGGLGSQQMLLLQRAPAH